MTCADALLDLDAWVRGELAPARAAEVAAHVDGCATCAREMAWLDGLGRALRATRPAPKDLDAEALAGRILAADARGRRAPRRGRTPRPPGTRSLGPLLVAAASLVIAVGLVAFRALERGGGSVAQGPRPLPPARPSPGTTPSPGTPPVEPTPTPVEPAHPPTPVEPPDPSPVPPAEPAPIAPVEPAPIAPEETPPVRISPTTAPSPGDALTGEVLAAGPGAQVSRDGGRTWGPVVAGEPLPARARLRAPRASGVEALVRTGPPAPGDLALAGTRLAIGPEGEAALGDEARPDALVVAAGPCLVKAAAAVVIVAGAARVEASAADVEVDLGRSGRAVLSVRAGEARLRGGATLRGGQQVEVDAQGRPGRVRRGPEGPPRWALALGAARRVLLRETLEDWERVGARRTGAAQPAGVVEGAAPSVGSTAREVSFGKSDVEGGLVRAVAGARVRFRYRVSGPCSLTLQVKDHTLDDNVHATARAPRPGLWSDVEVALAAMDDNARRGRRVAEGDLLGYVTLRAEGDGGLAVRLEVDEVVIDIP